MPDTSANPSAQKRAGSPDGHDVYDFEDGVGSDLANQAIADGEAHVYTMKSEWRQKMTLNYRREGNRLILEDSDWQDVEDSSVLQEGPN